MSAVAWLDRELERVTRRRSSFVAPPLTPSQQAPFLGVPLANVTQQYANTSASASALSDADVRRIEHPEEFPCEHGLPANMYCARCNS